MSNSAKYVLLEAPTRGTTGGKYFAIVPEGSEYADELVALGYKLVHTAESKDAAVAWIRENEPPPKIGVSHHR